MSPHDSEHVGRPFTILLADDDRGGPRAGSRRAPGCPPWAKRDEVRSWTGPGPLGLPAPRGVATPTRPSSRHGRGSSCSISTCPKKGRSRGPWPRSRADEKACGGSPSSLLTTSKDEADVLSTYDLGGQLVSSPSRVTFAGLVEVHAAPGRGTGSRSFELPNGGDGGRGPVLTR